MNGNNCIMELRRSRTATGTAHFMLGAQEATITRFIRSLPVRVSYMHCLTVKILLDSKCQKQSMHTTLSS